MQIVIDGRILNYIEVNPKGKTDLVVLHGWGHNGGLWQNLAKSLSTNIHCYLLDLPAFGASQPLLGHPDIPEYTQTIIDFITKVDLKKPILLGHSFGGQVAIDLVVKHNRHISQLILISPAGIRSFSSILQIRTKIAHALKPLTKIISGSTYEKILLFVTGAEYAKTDELHRQIIRRILRYDLTPILGEISVPTYLIWGSEDREISYGGKIMTEAIPNCQLTVMYGAGHNPHLSHTKKLAQIINQIHI